MEHRLMRVGLTGGVASGKSTVSRRLAELGAVIVDADLLAREVVGLGTPGLARVVEAFGPGVLTTDGDLDRAAVGAIVFADPARRRVLEGIIHPLVRARAAELEADAGPDALVVHDIPLLAETGQADTFDAVVVVDAPASVQVARMVADRGWTREDAEARIAAQAAREERLSVATYVIENVGTLDQLRARVDEVYTELRSGRAAQVRAAVELALTDFQHPTPVDLRVSVETASSGGGVVRVHARDGSAAGFWVDHPARGAELVVAVADFLGEHVFDQLGQTWGQARPPCPGHQHPARPVLFGGEAWWRCPDTGTRLGRVGELRG